jgi:hypothetical protein
MKPAVESLEERQLMSFVVGGSIGGLTLGGGAGTLNVGGAPQPLSNMSSVSDYFGNTDFFQINADYTVSYNTSSDPSGTWHNTGVPAASVSAGTSNSGLAVVGVIKRDQSVWVYNPGSVAWGIPAGWTNLNGKGLAISVTQGPEDASGLVYVIGTDSHLYVQDTEGHGWAALGTPTLSNGQHVTLDTISALSYWGSAGPASVCYATDNVGEVWKCTLNNPSSIQAGGIWTALGGPTAVQIAASFDADHKPIVYALSYNQFNNVSVFSNGGWTNLGEDALEISAGRSWGPSGVGPTRNTVYAVTDSHQVFVLDNSAYSDWTHVNTAGGPTWQPLGGNATAITAEATAAPGWLGNRVFESDANSYAYVYNNGWNNLLGTKMNPSYTPLNY